MSFADLLGRLVNFPPSIGFLSLQDFLLILLTGSCLFPLKLKPWRAASLCPFGGLDQFPSIEALQKNGKNSSMQAMELESGVGHQWRLWKWASYCASEVGMRYFALYTIIMSLLVLYFFNLS